jgi:class 3 adenylate cyclase
MALLRLAEGKADAAASMIARALDEDSPGPLARARLLPAQVEIAIAAGDLDTARSAVDEQDTIAETYRTPALEASAAYGRGAIELAGGDAAAACRSLRRGWRLWQEVGAPYEAARARLLLAEAYRAEGDEEAAVLELRAAKSTFDRLGAVPAAERAAALLGVDASASGAPAARAVKTFMFTDIVQSTALVEAMGDEAWEDLLRWHDQTLRSVFVAHAGEEVKITHEGDGFFLAFEDSVTAVQCAVDIQRTLAEHRRLHGFAPQVRIGLHTAEATRRGDDYGGMGVHQAARVAGLAGGGEIIASEAMLAAEPVPFSASELHAVSLKGISEPVLVAAIEWR